MIQELESATVVWFNRNKRYGFAKDGWGQQMFFHLNDGRNCRIENDQLVFYKPRSFVDNKVVTLFEPDIGNVIQFVRAKGSLGRPKAKPWTYGHMVTGAYVNDYYDSQLCSCGHRFGDHAGAICMNFSCHCGDERYEHEIEEYIGTNVSGDPGGFIIYDSLA